jgi:hypothetical protein
MDDKAHLTYTQFFGDVFNMCLFLQTQNFQQVTAALVQDMHISSAAANASLAAIRSDLGQQSKAVAQSLAALTRVQAVQADVAAAVQDGLSEIKALGVTSVQLTGSMNHSLELTVRCCVGWSVCGSSCASNSSVLSACCTGHPHATGCAGQQAAAAAPRL